MYKIQRKTVVRETSEATLVGLDAIIVQGQVYVTLVNQWGRERSFWSKGVHTINRPSRLYFTEKGDTFRSHANPSQTLTFRHGYTIIGAVRNGSFEPVS